jgi:hypothetical protein
MGTTSTTTFATTTINIILDTASTTQAVYAIGYSLVLFMGIFLLILTGSMSYKFFKGFL